jgi:hypothetical protein
MNLQIAIAVLLLLAAVFGAWRTAWVRGTWRWPLIVGPFVMAALLYLVLFPPAGPVGNDTLVVLTSGVSAEQMHARDRGLATIVLPGVEIEQDGIEHEPDLATALRRHPQMSRLRIVGGGLPQRDRDVVRHLGVEFEPAPLPVGIVELHVPMRVSAGSIWRLTGRVEVAADSRVELRDRSAAVIASAVPGKDGRFMLDVPAKTEGVALFHLRVLAADDSLIEEMPVPVVVRAGDSLHALVLAGAPDAELKYLRRWAIDAGIRISSRIALSRGISMRESDAALDVAALKETDLLIVDERAWAALAKPAKAAIGEAVDQGLGLLLRVTGPIPASVASEWAAFGFRFESVDGAQSVILPSSSGGATADVVVSRRPLNPVAADATALISAADGSVLASWRAQGRGRVAASVLLDTYRIALGGNSTRFGTLWSTTFATLARARGVSPPSLPTFARVDERSVLCGIGKDAVIEDADGMHSALLIDPAAPTCAAYWPNSSGWHVVMDNNGRWPFFVLSLTQGQALARAETARATAQLVRTASPDGDAATFAQLPRWPFFLAWLALTTMIWWLERRVLRFLE